MANLDYKYFLQDEGKAGYEQLLIGASPNTPFGSRELTLQEAQAYAAQKPNLLTSVLGPGITRESIAGWQNWTQAPSTGVLSSWTNPQTGETLQNVQQSTVNQITANANNPNLKNVGTAQAPQYVPIGTPNPSTVTGAGLQEWIGTPQGQAFLAANPTINPVLLTQTPTYQESANQPITPASLQSQPQTNLSGTMPSPSGAAETAMAGAATSSKALQDYINQQTTPQTEAEKKQQSILDEIAKITGEYAGKGAEQLSQEQAAGIPDIKKQVSELNSQINTKMAEFEQYRLMMEGKPVTMDTITGNIAQRKNQVAGEVLMLQARQQALQGQLTTAQENVNRAIDLKYETKQFALNTLSAQLDALQPTLTKEENIRATAVQAMLNDQQQALADQKQLDRDMADILLKAVSNGADSATVDQIQNADSLNSAIQLAGKWISEPQQVSTKYYRNEGDNDVREVATNRYVSASEAAGTPNFWSQVTVIPANRRAVSNENESSMVLDMATTYKDAGILPTDSLSVAQSKLKNSRIYQEQVRPPQYASSGGGGEVAISETESADIEAALLNSRGADGFVDPNTYQQLKDNSSSATEFDRQFSSLLSPQERKNLGITTAIITTSGKPLIDAQSTSLGYAQRMNDANSVIQELGGKFTGVLSYIGKIAPNVFKSEDRQKYEQAQRNFINSVLRKESGAAISPSEFDSAAKQYFPQPGDSKSVVEQKTANRNRAINNLLQSASVSQDVLRGDQDNLGDYDAYLQAIGQ